MNGVKKMPSHKDYNSLNTNLDELFNSLIEMPEDKDDEEEKKENDNNKKETK